MKLRNAKNGKTAVLVTGCSSGIGKTIAEHLAAHDFFVFATTKNVSDAKKISDPHRENLIPISPLDLTQREEIRAAVDSKSNLQSRGCNGLFGIVSNVGGGSIAPLELIDMGILKQELKTRILGP